MKKEKGITLVSLVITIIIILIIATIGIKASTTSMDLANYTAFQTELRVMQAKANEICENEIKENNNTITKPNIGTNASTNPTLKVQEVNKILQEKANKAGKNITQIEQGFNLWTKTDIKQTLKIENITQDFLVNIEECIVIAVEPFYYEGKDYYMLEQMKDSVYNVTYKNQVVPGEINLTTRINPTNQKHQIKVQILNSKYISKWEILWRKKGTSNWEKTKKFEFDVDGEGIYEVQAKNGDKIKLASEIEIKSIPGNIDENGIFTQTSTVDGKPATENNPIIPEGFKPSNINPRPTPDTVNKGFVITDGQAEFVWVPVPDITKMVGGTEKQNNPQERWGKLYSETNVDNPENGTNIAKPTTDYREPDVVTNYDGNTIYLKRMNDILGTTFTIDTFKTELEKDFYNMSESVKKYKGFYVGRYESSLVGSNNNAYLAPIKGATSANASDSLSTSWYGLYARQKKYKKGKIEGSMIWGCQYDAMMKWMKRAGVKNIETINPINIGGEVTSKNTGRTTGTVETDKLCNVYDLLGNSYEWTLETFLTYSRVHRGGNYSNSFSLGRRCNVNPHNTSNNDSTRATLYIP